MKVVDSTPAVGRVATYLASRDAGHPLRVGIDGVCGSGESTFAQAVTLAVEALGCTAVHLDSDGFHHVQAVRRRRRDDPARGYYDDPLRSDTRRSGDHVCLRAFCWIGRCRSSLSSRP